MQVCLLLWDLPDTPRESVLFIIIHTVRISPQPAKCYTDFGGHLILNTPEHFFPNHSKQSYSRTVQNSTETTDVWIASLLRIWNAVYIHVYIYIQFHMFLYPTVTGHFGRIKIAKCLLLNNEEFVDEKIPVSSRTACKIDLVQVCFLCGVHDNGLRSTPVHTKTNPKVQILPKSVLIRLLYLGFFPIYKRPKFDWNHHHLYCVIHWLFGILNLRNAN